MRTYAAGQAYTVWGRLEVGEHGGGQLLDTDVTRVNGRYWPGDRVLLSAANGPATGCCCQPVTGRLQG